jgi:hypothetical protein
MSEIGKVARDNGEALSRKPYSTRTQITMPTDFRAEFDERHLAKKAFVPDVNCRSIEIAVAQVKESSSPDTMQAPSRCRETNPRHLQRGSRVHCAVRETVS